MSLNYHNLMEDVVLQCMDLVLRANEGCRCDICKSDMAAYALNHLPPRYVVSDTGRMMTKLKSYESQFHTDVITALSEAAKLDHAHPRH